MLDDFTAVASTTIDAPTEVVWDALLNPDAVRQFMFGAEVRSDWHEGHPITWKGEWQGKKYEDKGRIKRVKPLRLLEYTHYSPLSGKPDRPENYHTVTIELTRDDHHTVVSITQDRNESREARVHSEKNWAAMLASLKKMLESAPSSHVPGPY
jgi:uncharacterized protein YndB with AHSA1/START domain